MEENERTDLTVMHFVQDNPILEKLVLYLKLVAGLKDFKNGKHEPFDKAMLDIRNGIG